MRIEQSAFSEIAATIGTRPAESGGMLGGSRLDGVVRRFEFDHAARATGATYSPDHHRLTQLLHDEWNPAGNDLLGFVHSHPRGMPRPSGGDLSYAARILEHLPDLDELLLPIVTSTPAHSSRIDAFAAIADGATPEIRPLELEVVDDAPEMSVDTDAFVRVREAYDLERMARSRLVVVGTGGASGFVEDMCRAGIGEVVLVDPDIVECPNLATQQVYLPDLGRPKVEALAARLLQVSPSVHVASVHASLDDIDDRDFARLSTSRLAGRRPPEVTIICGFTDDFWAQARVARLALNLGLPSLAAQVYAEGRGAEVSFALPGVTPACQRCALGSRYRAFLRDGYRNAVVSSGTPIFSTARLNALKGFVALALLHGAGERPASGVGARRWLRLLELIGARNLLMVRLDPDLAEVLGVKVFDRVLAGADSQRLIADETVWLPQEPENEITGFDPCGDCSGTGDLRDSIGKLPASRLDADFALADGGGC